MAYLHLLSHIRACQRFLFEIEQDLFLLRREDYILRKCFVDLLLTKKPSNYVKWIVSSTGKLEDLLNVSRVADVLEKVYRCVMELEHLALDLAFEWAHEHDGARVLASKSPIADILAYSKQYGAASNNMATEKRLVMELEHLALELAFELADEHDGARVLASKRLITEIPAYFEQYGAASNKMATEKLLDFHYNFPRQNEVGGNSPSWGDGLVDVSKDPRTAVLQPQIGNSKIGRLGRRLGILRNTSFLSLSFKRPLPRRRAWKTFGHGAHNIDATYPLWSLSKHLGALWIQLVGSNV